MKIKLKSNKKIIFGIFLIISFIFFSCFLLTSCGEKTIPIQSIKFAQEEYSLFKGQSQHLDIIKTPEKAGNYKINLSSSNDKIVEINKFGYMNALNYGEVTITATVVGTDIQAECKVTVNDGEICNFKIECPLDLYYEGQTFDRSTLKVYGIYETGKKVLLEEDQYTINIPNPLTIGSKISVTYQNYSTKYFTPLVREDEVLDIEILTPPNKTHYTIGENFDTTGLEVKLLWASGKKEITTNWQIDTITVGFKQTHVNVFYENFSKAIEITTQAQITVDSITKLQNAINEGYTSIMLTTGSYNTSTAITISSKENLIIFGQSQNTSINGFNIIPLKIEGACQSIIISDLTLTSIGETPTTHQIDLSLCESGNITLQNVTYLNILQSEEIKYSLKIEN